MRREVKGMAVRKLATCCYCGTRAALVLRGDERHELTCSNCGAPLQKLKMLPTEGSKPKKTKSKSKAVDHRPPVEKGHYERPKKYKRRNTLGRFLRRAAEEIWDEIEDILD